MALNRSNLKSLLIDSSRGITRKLTLVPAKKGADSA